ncbi:MAG: hypothetical protein D4R81_12350, partial [Nitrospiraceae bacterium]
MKLMLYRNLGMIAGLLILGSVALLGAEYATFSHAAGATTPATVTPATPVAQMAAPGFTEVARAVTPAVVNITAARVARGRDSRMPRDPMEEFGSPFGHPGGPRGHNGPME